MAEPSLPPGVPEHTVTPAGDDGDTFIFGVDVAAGGGDEFVVARLIGDAATIEHTSSGAVNANSVDVAGKVLEHIRRAEKVRLALGTEAKVRVKVDAIGVGWGVVSTLQAWADEGVHTAEIVAVTSAIPGPYEKGTSSVDRATWHERRQAAGYVHDGTGLDTRVEDIDGTPVVVTTGTVVKRDFEVDTPPPPGALVYVGDLGEDVEERLRNWFTYHPPVGEQVSAYEAIRAAGHEFARVLAYYTPKSADQTTALRKVREAVMTANAAIACGGR